MDRAKGRRGMGSRETTVKEVGKRVWSLDSMDLGSGSTEVWETREEGGVPRGAVLVRRSSMRSTPEAMESTRTSSEGHSCGSCGGARLPPPHVSHQRSRPNMTNAAGTVMVHTWTWTLAALVASRTLNVDSSSTDPKIAPVRSTRAVTGAGRSKAWRIGGTSFSDRNSQRR